MTKKLLVLILVVSIFSCVLALSACSNADSEDFSLQIGDGEFSYYTLQATYKYGERMTIFDTLTFEIVNLDGTIESISEGVSLSYTYKGEEKTSIDSTTLLDVGTYTITYSYKGVTAYLELTIEPASTIQNYSVSLIDIETSLPVSSIKYESTISSSKYKLVVKDGDEELQSEEIIGVYALTAAQRSDFILLTDSNEQLEYLFHKNTNSVSNSDMSLALNELIPGEYYLFAHVANRGNYEATFSLLSEKITVEKGEINISTQQVEDMGIYAEYSFNNSELKLKNEFDNEGNTIKKALTLNDLQESLSFGRSENSSEIAFPDSTGSIFSYGHFEFIELDKEIDCSDNGSTALAKFVLDEEYYNKIYEIVGDNEYPITLKISQGVVGLYQRGISYVYNGKEQKFAGTDEECDDDIVSVGYDSNLLKAENVVATNAGNYTAKFSLIDNVNYSWVDTISSDPNYLDGVMSINWTIAKLSGYGQAKITYNGSVVDSTNTIAYVDGVNTVSIEVLDDINSTYLTLRNDGKANFLWSFDTTTPMNDMTASLSAGITTTPTNTLNIESIVDGGSSYVNIVLACNENDNFEAFLCQITIYFEKTS